MKILVADVPHMDVRYERAFAGWEVAYARTMAEARRALAAAPYDLVVVGVYFDDSQMFDLVRMIRAGEQRGPVPIVCVRGAPGFTAVTTRTLEIALRALGVDEFMDLIEFDDDAEADAALRAVAERLAAP